MIIFKKNQILIILICILTILSLAYLSKGFYTLAFDSRPVGARDLLERWKEQQYIYIRTYPYFMNPTEIKKEIGLIRSGGYPPWAFFTGFLIFPPFSWTITRFYHVVLNIISLAILGRFAYQIGRPFGSLPAYFFVVASLGMSSHCTTLNNGQYGIIINALIIGVYWLIKVKKEYLGGFLMGMALAKPSISAPFLLSLMIHRKIKTITIALLYILIATFYIAWLTQLGFDTVMARFIQMIQYVADDGFSGIDLLNNLGISQELTFLMLSLITITLIFVIFYKLQKTDLLTLFACASVIGRVFTYHRSYDDVMLIFLLLAFLKLAFSSPNYLNIIITTLVGITLWFPLSLQNLLSPYWRIAQIIIWLIALVYLIFNSIIIQKATPNLTN